MQYDLDANPRQSTVCVPDARGVRGSRRRSTEVGCDRRLLVPA